MVASDAAVAKVATADARIAEAQRDAAKATLQAASSNEIAERERLARLQLEARLADRILSPAQQQSITTSLRPLGDFPTQVFWYADTTEVTRIADTIPSMLKGAVWTDGVGACPGRHHRYWDRCSDHTQCWNRPKRAANLLVSELARERYTGLIDDNLLEDIFAPGMTFGNTISNPQIKVMIKQMRWPITPTASIIRQALDKYIIALIYYNKLPDSNRYADRILCAWKRQRMPAVCLRRPLLF